MLQTEWRRIPEFPNYSISSAGEVRNDTTGRLLRLQTKPDGLVYVGMMSDRQHNRSVAKLVAEAFLSRPKRYFDTPINLNGDRSNNGVENLVWRPRWFATKYVRQFRQPFDNPITVPIYDTATELKYESSWQACKEFGLLEKDLVLSILNRTYVWPTWQIFDLV